METLYISGCTIILLSLIVFPLVLRQMQSFPSVLSCSSKSQLQRGCLIQSVTCKDFRVILTNAAVRRDHLRRFAYRRSATVSRPPAAARCDLEERFASLADLINPAKISLCQEEGWQRALQSLTLCTSRSFLLIRSRSRATQSRSMLASSQSRYVSYEAGKV